MVITSKNPGLAAESSLFLLADCHKARDLESRSIEVCVSRHLVCDGSMQRVVSASREVWEFKDFGPYLNL